MDFCAVFYTLCKVVAASLYLKNKNPNPPNPGKKPSLLHPVVMVFLKKKNLLKIGTIKRNEPDNEIRVGKITSTNMYFISRSPLLFFFQSALYSRSSPFMCSAL